MNIEQTFYELLQVALERRDRLTVTPSEGEWEELYALAEKQAMTGIAWVGVTRLPEEQRPEEVLFLRWTGWANKIKERNARMDELCGKLTSRFEREGFEAVILKGQAVAALYPTGLRAYRTSGDIDAWVWKKAGAVDEAGAQRDPSSQKLLRMTGSVGAGAVKDPSTTLRMTNNNRIAPVVRYCLSIRPGMKVAYHHVDFPVIPEVPVEVHFRPAWLSSPWANRRLQRWFQEEEQHERIPCDGFYIPTPQFNAVFLLLHIYKHLFEEGIGLRQLTDYFCVLHNNNPNVDCLMLTVELLREIHLEKFCAAVMWVLGEVFALPREEMLVEPDEERGRHLLEEIMRAGNFGRYDERNGDLAHEGHLGRFLRKTRRSVRLARLYPHEALWNPPFMIYHIIWRGLGLWRFS